MTSESRYRATARLLVILASLLAALLLGGCTSNGSNSGAGSPPAEPAKEPAVQEKPAEPTYTSWVVSIVDDASASKGGMKYDIALNLNATNPSADIAGKYTGTATAKTSTQGSAGGASVKASAIANSSQLEFTLAPVGAGSELKTLTEQPGYIGQGTITMGASGDASVGSVKRGISNNSSQPIEVLVVGSDVTLTITISGNKYKFKGKITGRE
jgi:hypothetical protein